MEVSTAPVRANEKEMRITGVKTLDIRFPTSRLLDGSDAMNADPDYSAAYVILETDSIAGIEGHGLTFTIGRGNGVCLSVIESLASLLIGRSLESLTSDMGAFWHLMTGDSQLRWLGPEKGVVHLAAAAVINAVWDLYAKAEGKPLWKLLSDMTPEQIVAVVPFRYITDAITKGEAVEMLSKLQESRPHREERFWPAVIRHIRRLPAGWVIRMKRSGRSFAKRSPTAGRNLR